jgi:hypothetical protein
MDFGGHPCHLVARGGQIYRATAATSPNIPIFWHLNNPIIILFSYLYLRRLVLDDPGCIWKLLKRAS